MNHPAVQAVLGVLCLLGVFVYPALCLSRIAARLGRRPLRYGLCSLLPLGSLVALGVLAFSGPPRPRGGAR
jgi:hypothetical protein